MDDEEYNLIHAASDSEPQGLSCRQFMLALDLQTAGWAFAVLDENDQGLFYRGLLRGPVVVNDDCW